MRRVSGRRTIIVALALKKLPAGHGDDGGLDAFPRQTFGGGDGKFDFGPGGEQSHVPRAFRLA